MALVENSGFTHVQLTVTDVARPKSINDLVYGRPTAIDASSKDRKSGF